MHQNWTARIITFILWALAASSAVFWLLQSTQTGTRTSAGSVAVTAQTRGSSVPRPETFTSLTPQVALVLGAKQATAPTALSELSALQARFQLLGVLGGGGNRGVALIALDGKPAKPYRVGAALDEDLQVRSVAARSVSIGRNGQPVFEMALPALSAAGNVASSVRPSAATLTPKAPSSEGTQTSVQLIQPDIASGTIPSGGTPSGLQKNGFHPQHPSSLQK